MKKYQMQKYKVRFKRNARGTRGLITNDERCVSGLYVEAEFTYMQIRRFFNASSSIEVMIDGEYIDIISMRQLDATLQNIENKPAVKENKKEEPKDGHIENVIDEDKQYYKVYDAPRRRYAVTNSLEDPGEPGVPGRSKEIKETQLTDKIEVEESIEVATEASPDPDVESDVEEDITTQTQEQSKQNKNNNYQQNNKYNNNKNKNNQYQQQQRKK